MDLDAARLSATEVYKILVGSVLPRPIAWVSTCDSSGRSNLAPFSFFTVASVNPPILCLSPLLDEQGKEKHSLVNIRQTGEFVVNIVSHGLVEQMNQTSAPYPAEVSEFSAVGLNAQPSISVRPPGVKESLVRFECTLRQVLSFGAEPLAGNLILGEVRTIHLHPGVYSNDRVDGRVLDAVGRLAGNFYATTRDQFSLPRPHLSQPSSRCRVVD